MTIIYMILKIVGIVFALLFTIYYFNLDMKLVSVIYQALGKRFDKQQKDSSL